MIRKIYILLFLLLAVSCQRRPLTVSDNNVQVNIEVDYDIVNYGSQKHPSLMRVMFFDNATGDYATQAFLPENGGAVSVIPGRTYDVLVYNFDIENTIIGSEYDYNSIFAYTNEVPESYKTKLKSRSTKIEDEMIVFEPDHLFVGRLLDVYIPVRAAEEPPVVLDIKAGTIVETWKLILENVKGVEWVGEVSGVITGLSHSRSLSSGRRSDNVSSVFFESVSLDENGRLEAVFNTFGYNPDFSQVVSLVITDTAGQGHEFNIDVSSQFEDNAEQVIYIKTDEVVIDEPEEGEEGGGIAPDVDEWENIEVDITI